MNFPARPFLGMPRASIELSKRSQSRSTRKARRKLFADIVKRARAGVARLQSLENNGVRLALCASNRNFFFLEEKRADFFGVFLLQNFESYGVFFPLQTQMSINRRRNGT